MATLYALYCSDKGGHRRARVGTGEIVQRPDGAWGVKVLGNSFRRKPTDPVTGRHNDAAPDFRGEQIHLDHDRGVYIIDCHRCRPSDLPDHAKTAVKIMSPQRLGALLERVRDTPELRGGVDLSYFT